MSVDAARATRRPVEPADHFDAAADRISAAAGPLGVSFRQATLPAELRDASAHPITVAAHPINVAAGPINVAAGPLRASHLLRRGIRRAPRGLRRPNQRRRRPPQRLPPAQATPPAAISTPPSFRSTSPLGHSAPPSGSTPVSVEQFTTAERLISVAAEQFDASDRADPRLRRARTAPPSSDSRPPSAQTGPPPAILAPPIGCTHPTGITLDNADGRFNGADERIGVADGPVCPGVSPQSCSSQPGSQARASWSGMGCSFASRSKGSPTRAAPSSVRSASHFFGPPR